MNPRRSSRAHPNPPSAAMQPTNSTGSSTSAGRAERNTRSNNKASPSRRQSTQQRSQSIDDVAAVSAAQNDLAHQRHRQRSRDEQANSNNNSNGTAGTGTGTVPPANNHYDEDEGDEEEITRCICGQQDYPGLPAPARARLARSSSKSGAREDLLQSAAAAATDPLADEPGSLFIQCDSCKVWQHGGCVGIMDEATCPEEYFCEECRKDMHKIAVDAKGNKSSLYSPVVAPKSPSSSSSSPSRNNSRKARDKKSKKDANPAASKRRSTMNSRDAAYDEEEQIRRAIAESKGENKPTVDESGAKKNKRSRSDSGVNKQSAKRQRTGSPSPSTISKKSRTNSQPDSEDETKSKASTSGTNKKTRATATRNQRETDTQTERGTEKDTGQDASGRRKGRAERRKGDAEPGASGSSPAKIAPNSTTRTPSAPDTPDIAAESGTSRTATRKSGRPARRGRVGRNQYTRDRDVNGGESTHANGNSPRRGNSRDGASGDSPTGGHTGANGVHLNGGESGRPSRPRHMNPNRTSMNDMRKRVAGILEFISRMQVEMAASGEQQAEPPNGEASTGSKAGKDSSNKNNNGSGSGGGGGGDGVAAVLSLVQDVMGDQASAMVNGDTTQQPSLQGAETSSKEKDFKDLSSVDMMDVLARGLLKWQQEYGKYGEK